MALVDENEKFSQYLIDQLENSQNNFRKLLEFNNEELKLLTEKVILKH